MNARCGGFPQPALTQPAEMVIFITVLNNVGTLPSAIITYS